MTLNVQFAMATVLLPDKVYTELMFPFFVLTNYKHHLLSMS